jgi:hypothetical protein
VSSNPYAAPNAGADVGGGRGFAFSDELRKLISSTATLMIVAGILQMIPGVAMLLGGLSAVTVVGVLFFGVVPAFTTVAGFSLRALAKPGDDLGALSTGFRALFIPFLAKGIVMLVVVGLTLLGLLLSIVGIGAGFFAMWN